MVPKQADEREEMPQRSTTNRRRSTYASASGRELSSGRLS